MYGKAQGKFIAVCEGDDYWTEPDKLQKQAELLDAHANWTMCFHNVLIVGDARHYGPQLAYNDREMKAMYRFVDLFPGNFIHTPSVLFRAAARPRGAARWSA